MSTLGDAELARSLEEAARRFPAERGELLLEAGELWQRSGFVSADELLEMPGRIPARRVRSLFWQVGEFGEAIRRWPAVFSGNGADHAAYHARLESRWRQLAERGVAHLNLVPASADGLARFAERTGGDPSDERTRQAYMSEVDAAGAGIEWPPARNAACWCGSGRKYKKCCGNPTGRSTTP